MSFAVAVSFCCWLVVFPNLIRALSVQQTPLLNIVQADHQHEVIRYYQNKTVHDILASKSKLVNVTCPELNNFTFTNEIPFDILGLPECGDRIEPELELFLNDENKTQCELDVRNLPNAKTTGCFQRLKAAQGHGKVVIVTHGFLNNFDTNWLHSMKNAIQDVEEGTAVIVSSRAAAFSSSIMAAITYNRA